MYAMDEYCIYCGNPIQYSTSTGIDINVNDCFGFCHKAKAGEAYTCSCWHCGGIGMTTYSP